MAGGSPSASSVPAAAVAASPSAAAAAGISPGTLPARASSAQLAAAKAATPASAAAEGDEPHASSADCSASSFAAEPVPAFGRRPRRLPRCAAGIAPSAEFAPTPPEALLAYSSSVYAERAIDEQAIQ